MAELCDRLTEYMTLKSLNTMELADITGIPNSMISRYANFNVVPKLSVLIKLSNTLNFSIEYLLGRTDNETFVLSTPPSDFKTIFNQLLKDKHLKSVKLSQDLSILHSNISKWKKGAVPTVYFLEKLADYFGVTIDYLVGREK